mmetsp:Transcript_22419/g.31174  ORF Transcript_22419/g.31174 Transcript_22419/m.31174 type:complete len:101 (+) Transcript_22419:205-507(+)
MLVKQNGVNFSDGVEVETKEDADSHYVESMADVRSMFQQYKSDANKSVKSHKADEKQRLGATYINRHKGLFKKELNKAHVLDDSAILQMYHVEQEVNDGP